MIGDGIMCTEKEYQHVFEAMDNTYTRTIRDGLIRQIDISAERMVFVSDIHKGARDCADDFLVSEKAYNTMLAYYFELGHTLVVLGDAEELWENSIRKVMKKYAHSLEKEGKFLNEGRYIRIWGNHDRDWKTRRKCEKHLFKALMRKHPVSSFSSLCDIPEAYLLEVRDGEEVIGRIFLVHGHQGSLESDRFRWLSRIAVRVFVRPIQCWFKKSWNPKTPAHDASLRKANNIGLYRWSEKQEDLILIAGHTHRPVFASETHLDKLKRKQSMYDPGDPEYQQKMAEIEAEIEWAITQEYQMPDDMHEQSMAKQCYFNTGCCCFVDGNTTAIEICDGEIRLVHWPNKDDQPKPFTLKHESLKKIFTHIADYQKKAAANP